VERTDNNDDGLAGVVPETPRSSDETTSSDPVVDRGVAREDTENPVAAGVPAGDEDSGDARKNAYKRGATLVSRID
jgi:hypothetical protein